MRDSMNEVLDLMKARVTCIWIKSYEEDEVIKDLKEIVRNNSRFFPRMSIHMWSNTEGLTELALHQAEEQKPADPKVKEIPALFAVARQLANPETGRSAMFILRDYHAQLDNSKARRYIRDFAEYQAPAYYSPFIVISPYDNIPNEIARLFRVVDYGLPDKNNIMEYVRTANDRIARQQDANPEGDFAALGEEKLREFVDACVGLTIKEIHMILNESSIKKHTLDISFALKNKVESIRKSGAIDYIVPHKTMDDIGGNEALKEWLDVQRICFSKEARDCGVAVPKGYLAVGIPGTSKTAVAEAFAGSMHWPLLKFDMSKVMSKMVGDSEKNIAATLQVARASAPCVLLIDEVEKCLGGISSSNHTDSGITARVFESILDFLNDDNNGVYVIMTSNDISQLPGELTRKGRIDQIWYSGLPSESERADIFRIHFGLNGQHVSDLMIDKCAEEAKQFTGAEIQEVVKAGVRLAFVRHVKTGEAMKLSMDDMMEAIHDIVPIAVSSEAQVADLELFAARKAKRTSNPDADNDNDEQVEIRHVANGGIIKL